VIEWLLKAFDSAVNCCSVVGFLASARPLVLLKKAEFEIRIPVAMGYPAAKKPDHARELVPRVLFRAVAVEFRQDFIPQGRRYLFVGVKKENPSVCGHLFDQVLLPDVTEPFVLIHSISVFSAYLGGFVSAETVDHDDLIRPSGAFETAADVLLFITCYDANRDFLTHTSK